MAVTRERHRALWQSRSRALQRLAEAHWDEFVEMRNEELQILGEPPVEYPKVDGVVVDNHRTLAIRTAVARVLDNHLEEYRQILAEEGAGFEEV